WDTTEETAGFSRFVRLVAVDTSGAEHLSSGAVLVKEPAIQCQELDFLGPLDLGALALQEATPCHDWPAILVRVLQTLDDVGVDPGVMPVLWAVETVPGELTAPDLILRSPAPDSPDVDSNYAVWRDVPLLAQKDGILLFLPDPEPAPCSSYEGRLSALTPPELDPETGALDDREVRDSGTFAVNCLEVDATFTVRGAACGDAPPGLVDVTLEPTDLTGDDDLAHVSLLRERGDGSFEELFRVDGPLSGARYEYLLDLAAYGEGAEGFLLEIANLSGDRRVEDFPMNVDRTAPVIDITFPEEGAVVCGFQGELDILGTVFEAVASPTDRAEPQTLRFPVSGATAKTPAASLVA
ncbi:MAG: hypothetical protein AAFX50_25630, partial [Acidobacteriota bacterium]